MLINIVHEYHFGEFFFIYFVFQPHSIHHSYCIETCHNIDRKSTYNMSEYSKSVQS